MCAQGTLLRQDIVTHLAKQELGILPQSTMAAGRVNATIRSYVANVYLFDTSSAFKEYAARLRYAVHASGRGKCFLTTPTFAFTG